MIVYRNYGPAWEEQLADGIHSRVHAQAVDHHIRLFDVLPILQHAQLEQLLPGNDMTYGGVFFAMALHFEEEEE